MWRRLRPYIIALALIGAGVGGFVGVVAPLFAGGGKPQAEVTGLFDAQLTAGRSGNVSVAVDNTGDTQINPLCVTATFSGGVKVTSVIFANTDVRPFVNGRACGGGLIGQETINVIFVITPQSVGRIEATVTPLQGSTAVGVPLRGHIDVTAP